jgi:hypothetical protein
MSGGAAMSFGDPRLPERFWDKVYPCPITGCWFWAASKDGSGYGMFGVAASRCRRAHLVIYAAINGEPSGLQVDHTCHYPSSCRGGVACPHRSCVNPEHLDGVGAAINNLRGGSPSARNARKNVCPQKHPYDSINTINLPGGGRRCRKCRGAQNARPRKAGLWLTKLS